MKNLPPIGQRIIKSAAAVALCMIVYYFRTKLPIGNGIPFYSALAALWCMQPYPDTTKNNAWQRSFGTLTGAAYGLVFILLMLLFSVTVPIAVYVLEYICHYFEKNGKYPSETEIKSNLNCFRDLIAYRIVISMPACHIKSGENSAEVEQKYLYEIAEILPEFLEERGFSAEHSGFPEERYSDRLKEDVRPYYRDYVCRPRSSGYQSLHITFYDNLARCYTELQLRTKDMDDFAEIGDANHFGYEKSQEKSRTKSDLISAGECIYYDEAMERLTKLQSLSLADINVNMFKAFNNHLINDGCGLFRGRQILPFEHLSRFQNDMID